jgi:cysteinyl-tRNA synthetase
MSTKYLGNRFDIHTGGIEHVGVHHTNEIAQGYGAFGRQTANYWLHNAWLMSKDGEKMSKSLGNFVTAQDLLAQGQDPLALRYLIFTSQYRSGLRFGDEALLSAARSLKNLRQLLLSFQVSRTALSVEKNKQIESYHQRFSAALADDLNLPQALAVVWAVAKSSLPASDKRDLLLDFDRVLGFDLLSANPQVVPIAIQQLLVQRETARQQQNWTLADQLRLQIEGAGWSIKDTVTGPKATKQ